MPLNERLIWGQLVEAATQGTEINETTHVMSAMTDTITPYVDVTSSPTSRRTMVSIRLQGLRRFQRSLRIGRQPVRREKQTHE